METMYFILIMMLLALIISLLVKWLYKFCLTEVLYSFIIKNPVLFSLGVVMYMLMLMMFIYLYSEWNLSLDM